MTERSGGDVLLEVLASQGVRHIFGNPGTTELPLMDALAGAEGFEYVLCLHEGTVIGMADGYAQATGRPSFVNLHTAPGLGNAMGVLTNVAATGTPMVVTAGQQHRGHLLADPFLSGDLVGLARGLAKWASEVHRVQDLGPLLRRAFHDAAHPPTGPVFVSIPMDVLEEDGAEAPPPPSAIDSRTIPANLAEAARRIREADPERFAIVAGDEVARSGAVPALISVAERVACPVFGVPLYSNTVFPTAHPLWAGGLPSDGAAMREALSRFDLVLLIGARGFMTFWYGEVGPLPPGLGLIHLSPAPSDVGRIYPVQLGLVGDPAATLAALAELLPEAAWPTAAARLAEAARRQAVRWDGEDGRDPFPPDDRAAAAGWSDRSSGDDLPDAPPSRGMSPRATIRAVLRALPPEATVVEEAPTADPLVRLYHRVTSPDRFFYSRGGALGWGMGAALGLSLGRGGDRVTCIVGDGSAMYSPQALWTAARQHLPVLFVLLRNDAYLILRRFLEGMKGRAARTGSYVGMDLVPPAIDFVALSRSLGVEARRVERLSDVADAVAEGLAVDGPFLLELVVAASIEP